MAVPSSELRLEGSSDEGLHPPPAPPTEAEILSSDGERLFCLTPPCNGTMCSSEGLMQEAGNSFGRSPATANGLTAKRSSDIKEFFLSIKTAATNASEHDPEFGNAYESEESDTTKPTRQGPPAPSASEEEALSPRLPASCNVVLKVKEEEEEDKGLRSKIHRLLEEPDSSGAAKVMAVVSLLVILASTITLLTETLPQFQRQSREGRGPWLGLEIGYVIYFTLEILVRVAVSPDRRVFFTTALNIVDVVAVLPFYIELVTAAAVGSDNSSGASGLRVLRVIRVVRVFRLLKIARYTEGIKLIMVVMVNSKDVLILVLFIVVFSLVLWSTILFYAESHTISTFNATAKLWTRTVDGEEEYSPFQSIPATFWWTISTVTVVGYGDDVPQSGAAKAVAAVTMITGAFLLAIPASVFGSNFLSEYKQKQLEKQQERQAAQDTKAEAIVNLLNLLVTLEADGTRNEVEGMMTRLLWDDDFATRAVRGYHQCLSSGSRVSVLWENLVAALGKQWVKRKRKTRKDGFDAVGLLGSDLNWPVPLQGQTSSNSTPNSAVGSTPSKLDTPADTLRALTSPKISKRARRESVVRRTPRPSNISPPRLTIEPPDGMSTDSECRERRDTVPRNLSNTMLLSASIALKSTIPDSDFSLTLPAKHHSGEPISLSRRSTNESLVGLGSGRRRRSHSALSLSVSSRASRTRSQGNTPPQTVPQLVLIPATPERRALSTLPSRLNVE